MRITNIAFGEDGLPKEVSVVMPVAIAAYLTKWAGSRTSPPPEAREVYRCFADGLFNRFWEDGVNDYPAEEAERGYDPDKLIPRLTEEGWTKTEQ